MTSARPQSPADRDSAPGRDTNHPPDLSAVTAAGLLLSGLTERLGRNLHAPASAVPPWVTTDVPESDSTPNVVNPHMELPCCFSPRPTPRPDCGTIAAFERLFAKTVERGAGRVIDYTLVAPKWQFLCYLCDHKEIVLHGSGQPDILEFEPRQSNDIAEFGNRRAVYAASDGIWPIYFAVIDRDGGVTSLVNSCARVVGSDGSRSEPYYFFSINADALSRRPGATGRSICSHAKALSSRHHGPIVGYSPPYRNCG